MERPPTHRLLPEPEPEPEPDSDGGSVVLRTGSVVAGGALAALVSSLPAALRLGDGARALQHWVVLAALATPVAVAAVAVLRRARVGVRLVVVVGERASTLALGALWWSVIEVALLSVFGAVLKKTTHHHALAGVTFAVFALVSGVLVALLAWHVTDALARGGTKQQRIGLAVAGGAAFVALILTGLRLTRAEVGHPGAILVDVLAFAIASTIASSRVVSGVRPMALAGVPVAVVLIVVGLTTLRFDEALRSALIEIAPVHAWLVELLG